MNAPANRTFEHAREWVKAGADVTVITCVPNFPAGKVFNGYKNKFIQRESIQGIKVIRVWSYIAANEGKFKRIADYLSYAFMATFIGLFIKTDVIIATSPQFFTAIAGGFLGFFKRRPWIMEVRDIWPESIVAVGAMKKGALISFLEWVEMRLYKDCKKIFVVTDSFKMDIINKGINKNKITVVKNGVFLERFRVIDKDTYLLGRLKLEDKFIIAYFGTHGMAHKLDFILNSAKYIEDENIHFLFIGDGAERERLIKLKDDSGLKNVTLLPSVPKEEIQRFISIIDVALVNLKKSDTFKSVIPSKIFENAAMLKPILLGVDGESRTIIEDYRAGLYFEPENTEDFIEKVAKIKNERESYLEGCRKLALDYNRTDLAKKMLDEIKNIL